MTSVKDFGRDGEAMSSSSFHARQPPSEDVPPSANGHSKASPSHNKTSSPLLPSPLPALPRPPSVSGSSLSPSSLHRNRVSPSPPPLPSKPPPRSRPSLSPLPNPLDDPIKKVKVDVVSPHPHRPAAVSRLTMSESEEDDSDACEIVTTVVVKEEKREEKRMEIRASPLLPEAEDLSTEPGAPAAAEDEGEEPRRSPVPRLGLGLGLRLGGFEESKEDVEEVSTIVVYEETKEGQRPKLLHTSTSSTGHTPRLTLPLATSTSRPTTPQKGVGLHLHAEEASATAAADAIIITTTTTTTTTTSTTQHMRMLPLIPTHQPTSTPYVPSTASNLSTTQSTSSRAAKLSYYLHDCVAEGTLVALADGSSCPIEEVQVGTAVLTYAAAVPGGEKEGLTVGTVDAVLDKGYRACVELLFDDGRTLVCTLDHRIRTADRRWVEAGDLLVGTDEVAATVDYAHDTAGAEGASIDATSRVLHLCRVQLMGRRVVGDKHVYDLSVPNPQGEDSRSFLANGVLVHNCSPITSTLYISGQIVASDSVLLHKHGITHIVNACGAVCDNVFPGEFEYYRLFLQDKGSEDVLCILYDVYEFIQAAVANGGRALVHCQQGVSRSTVLGIGYLMLAPDDSEEGWSYANYQTAYTRVRGRRGISSPNLGFVCQLLAWSRRLMGRCVLSSSLYRFAPHSASDPRVVNKWMDSLDNAAFDSRFILLMQSPHAFFIWVGEDVSAEREDATRPLLQKVVRNLQRFEFGVYRVVLIRRSKDGSTDSIADVTDDFSLPLTDRVQVDARRLEIRSHAEADGEDEEDVDDFQGPEGEGAGEDGDTDRMRERQNRNHRFDPDAPADFFYAVMGGRPEPHCLNSAFTDDFLVETQHVEAAAGGLPVNGRRSASRSSVSSLSASSSSSSSRVSVVSTASSVHKVQVGGGLGVTGQKGSGGSLSSSPRSRAGSGGKEGKEGMPPLPPHPAAGIRRKESREGGESEAL